MITEAKHDYYVFLTYEKRYKLTELDKLGTERIIKLFVTLSEFVRTLWSWPGLMKLKNKTG